MRFRPLRAVVHLCLIVVMMIQPGIALAFATDCREKCESSFACQGCGCCEVSSPSEKCCCCDGGGEASHVSASNCCVESDESSTGEDTIRDACVLDSGESVQQEVIVIKPTDFVVMIDLQGTESDRVLTGCHCGLESQPLGDSSPVRPTIKQRDSIAMRFADLASIFGDAIPRPPRVACREDASSPPHFSQIHLCIWRL